MSKALAEMEVSCHIIINIQCWSFSYQNAVEDGEVWGEIQVLM